MYIDRASLLAWLQLHRRDAVAPSHAYRTPSTSPRSWRTLDADASSLMRLLLVETCLDDRELLSVVCAAKARVCERCGGALQPAQRNAPIFSMDRAMTFTLSMFAVLLLGALLLVVACTQ